MTKSIASTIVTKKFLAYARTLANTLVEHNPESRLFVLLADRVDGYFNPEEEPFELVQLGDLGDQDVIEKMCFYFTSYELCCALRGLFHEYMMNKISAQKWLFFDSDIMVCHSLEGIWKKLEGTSIMLYPHCTTTVEAKHICPHEMSLLRGGLYNAGFIGLRRTDETQIFISWFKERLRLYGFYDPSKGKNVDQLWLNLVPLYFKDASFLLDPGANLGHWNLHEKTLKKEDNGNITVNGQPLLFVHFSGWDISNPNKVSKFAPMYNGKTPPLWIELAESYRKKLLANGYETAVHYPYAFDYFYNGKPIAKAMRSQYYNDLVKNTARKGSPFASHSYFKSHLHLKETCSIGLRSFLRCIGGNKLEK